MVLGETSLTRFLTRFHMKLS